MTLDEPEKMQVLKSKSRTPNYIKDWTLQITEDEKTGHTQAHNMPTIRLFPILTMETIKSTLFIHIHFGHFGLLIRLKRLISRWSNFPWPISLGQSLVARACLGSRQLQYQPISRGNFPKHYLQNLVTDRTPRSVHSVVSALS